MADRNNAATGNNLSVAPPTAPKSIWVKQAEEAKLKSDAEKDAAAKAAFEATFNQSQQTQPLLTQATASNSSSDSDSDDDDKLYRKNLPAGPVDPAKCTANGAGIAGGTACVGATFTVVAKDSEGQKVDKGGAEVKVRITPAVGVGGNDQDGIVKDLGDGSYSVTYVVPKRGNYMVSVECNGRPIMGSPFPVFFSAGTPAGVLGISPAATYPNLVNQTMPNMPNYTGSVSGAFPGLIGMMAAGASGGVVLPGMGSALGEICRDYLNGRCAATDCKFNHPAHSLITTALSAIAPTGGVYNQVSFSPSAAAMAAAQAIVAAQTLQAHALAQAKAQSKRDPAAEMEANAISLKKTVQVSNLTPLLTVDQLKQLFGFYGTVVECTITDSKHFAYIEYSKPEEAAAALASNNMDLAGRPLNVEMAKTLPPKTFNSASSSAMQQAVAMQQMQFQQALLMQQSLTAQQAANRAATMKSATDLAAARAAEISKKLKAEGLTGAENGSNKKSRSPSVTRLKSRSRSRSKSLSPINYRLRRRSRSLSPPNRRGRGYRSKSPVSYRHYSSYEKERRYYRDSKDDSYRNRRRDSGRSYDKRSPASRRNRSRSVTPRPKKSYRDDSASPKRHRESPTERSKKLARNDSRSPRPHKRRSPSSGEDNSKSKQRRRSMSRSHEINHPSSDKKDVGSREKSKNRSGRRSISRSPEDHKRRSPSSGEDNSKSKHRRRSRSRSGEAKHKSSDKKDLRSREKSKNRSGRKSRSRSPEDRNHGKRSPGRVTEESKSRRKRRSRSRSMETKTQSSDKLERGREDKARHRDRKRSALGSTEGKQHKAREMSPDSRQHSDDPKPEGRNNSWSSEHGHIINDLESNLEELEQADERSVAP